VTMYDVFIVLQCRKAFATSAKKKKDDQRMQII